MFRWKYITILSIFLSLFLIGCSSGPDEANSPLEEENSVDKRTDFGDHFIEKDEIVAYIKPNKSLYVYNHEHEDEFFVQENVEKFDLFKDYVLYIAADGSTSELDIPLQSIYRTHVHSQDSEKMAEPSEEDGAYTTPRSFHLNNNGYVAVETEVGFFYSNYWFDYTATDIDFSFEKPIVTLEDEYDFVLNEIQWQDNEIYLLIDQGPAVEENELHTELRSFSIEDGEQLVQEKALPLSSEEYNELVDHTVYIGVEHSILYISAVDDTNVEKIAYEIDLDTLEVLYKTTES